MNEDKLSHNERLRLECIAQAVAFLQMKPHMISKNIVEVARVFEEYLRERTITPQQLGEVLKSDSSSE